MEWCEHMDSNKLDAMLTKVIDAKFCPECGKPRSSKKLWEKMRDVKGITDLSYLELGSLANTALDWFEEQVGEIADNCGYIRESELLERIRSAR